MLTHRPGMTMYQSRVGVRMQTHLALRRARVIYLPQMVLNRTSMACRRVVIDDRSRLPGRFFGRFATSATSELSAAL
jgi:hypothetical protein